MKCEHLDPKGFCRRTTDECTIGGYQACMRKMKCRHEGNVQACLDKLIDLNESEVLWQDSFATPTIANKTTNEDSN